MATEIQSRVAELEANMAQVILGKPEVIRMCIVALLAGEHVLLEDVPGVGKTLVGQGPGQERQRRFLPHPIHARPAARATSSAAACFRPSRRVRLQPRADLRQYRAGRRDQPHHAPHAKRPARSDERRQVSVDGQTHPLPRPFMVIATQNPFEFEGTYPLPESQLDRFLMRISIGYPDRDDELQVLLGPSRGRAGRYAAAGGRWPADRCLAGIGAPGGGGRSDPGVSA